MEAMIPVENIQSKIYIIRGKKVMLDRDLAFLYQIKPYRLREQVKRNLNRFPEDFMFKLNDTEVKQMVSQNAIPSLRNLGGTLPYVFTEYGALMVANIIRSNIATDVSIHIVRAFVKMRELISANLKIQQKLQELESKYSEHDKEIAIIFEAIKQLMEPPPDDSKKQIGFITENI